MPHKNSRGIKKLGYVGWSAGLECSVSKGQDWRVKTMKNLLNNEIIRSKENNSVNVSWKHIWQELNKCNAWFCFSANNTLQVQLMVPTKSFPHLLTILHYDLNKLLRHRHSPRLDQTALWGRGEPIGNTLICVVGQIQYLVPQIRVAFVEQTKKGACVRYINTS